MEPVDTDGVAEVIPEQLGHDHVVALLLAVIGYLDVQTGGTAATTITELATTIQNTWTR